MAQLSTRGSYAWIVVAHITGAALLGGLEAWRLGNPRLALALIPVFAATGLLAGCTCAVVERIAGGRRWWIAALAIAAPSLIVTVPVCAKLFDGAYAQTLPLAQLLPYAVPVLAWLGLAGVIAIGRKVAAGDLTSRAILILVVSGAIGAVIWAKRLLGSGYLGAQTGATITVLVLAGVIVRLARRAQLSAYVGAAISSIVVGTTVAALTAGLAVEQDRRLVVTYGDQGRDLVRLWRGILDFDGDGSSALLGGGDCDDRDSAIHPGALDVPGDLIDQDCDGDDAVVIPPPPPPRQVDQTAFRASLDTSVLLERTKGMNVVVITVDALRFDPLAPDAPDRADFPRLVKLLDESVFFTRAVAPASGTDVSLGTLLTGRFDPFQVVDSTLPEAIRGLGRHTASAMPSEVLRHVGEVMLGRGIDRVRKVYTDWEREDVGDHISSDDITREAIKSIRSAAGKPFFVWAHYFDVHEHHQIEPTAELARSVHPGGSPAVHRYRAMLLAVDRGIGGLLDELDKRQLRDDTIVVFASDHGESLKEDPRLLDTHGIVAYAPLVRIPLAFRVPGVPGGRRIDPVSLVDIAPTLLDLLCAPQAMGRLDGTSLVPALLDGPAELRPPRDRALVSHEEQQWSVVVWPHQVLVKPADDLVELYDLEQDPLLRDDLAGKLPEVTRRLRARYGSVPQVRVDRTLDGRAWRERQALPPQRHARP
jgi:choline-sulfatase